MGIGAAIASFDNSTHRICCSAGIRIDLIGVTLSTGAVMYKVID